jgi:hypothetical protein
LEDQKKHPDHNPQIDKSPILLLWLFLSADLAYIILHILYKATPFITSAYFSVKRDLGYSEFFQYMKFLWIIILLVYLVKRSKIWGYLAWAAVFLYFLADDAFQVHENVGRIIAGNLDFVPPFNLRLQDFGELAVYAIAGTILLLGITLSYWRGSKTFRGISIDILLLISILVFFGVVVDMAEIAADRGVFVKETLGLIDDGGEMIVTSVMVWYIFRLALRDGGIDTFLHQRLRAASTPRKSTLNIQKRGPSGRSP